MLNLYRKAAAQSGRALASIVMEALRLRFTGVRLGLTEYIDFQLYESKLSFAEKKAFAGQRAQSIIEDILIDDYSKFLSLDKVTMHALLSGLQIPAPKIRATYRSLRPSSIVQLQSIDDVAQFLSTPSNLPLYVKRAFGAYGRGNVLIEKSDGASIELSNGRRESIQEFCNSLDDGRSLGWIFQEPLTSHSGIQRITGSTKVSGVRVHTFLSLHGVRIIRAIFKINAGLRDSDNFEHGASGNMLAAVDIDTGKIIRAISGTGLNQKSITDHPITGSRLIGFEIPYWNEIIQLVTDGQKAFPGYLCPGWDIAICEDGPKVLEVNSFGDIDLSQHAYQKGFIDETFISLLRERGLDHLIYAPARTGIISPVNHRAGVRKHHWPW